MTQQDCYQWFTRQIATFKAHDSGVHPHIEYRDASYKWKGKWIYLISARCLLCNNLFLMPPREDPKLGDYGPGTLTAAWKAHTNNSPFCLVSVVQAQ